MRKNEQGKPCLVKVDIKKMRIYPSLESKKNVFDYKAEAVLLTEITTCTNLWTEMQSLQSAVVMWHSTNHLDLLISLFTISNTFNNSTAALQVAGWATNISHLIDHNSVILIQEASYNAHVLICLAAFLVKTEPEDGNLI